MMAPDRDGAANPPPRAGRPGEDAEQLHVVRPANSGPRRRRVVVVASFSPSLTRFRLELLKRMTEAGHEVIALAPEDDSEVSDELAAIGVRFMAIPMARAGINPIEDLQTIGALWRRLRQLRPDAIVPYTMKPIIYGGIAARLAGIGERSFLVTGLGYVFSDMPASARHGLVRRLSVWLYRRAFAGARVVFAYNEADVADIIDHRMLGPEVPLVRVAGSGVDLDHYRCSPPPSGPPVFLLVARLLKDKGIHDFVEAARIVRRTMPQAEFRLLGQFDPNPAAISEGEVDGWVREGILTYLGETRDVRPHLAACSVFVLPSYYREGIPRSILEAMSTGRAIITTDMPGCRDTVEPGVNGYLVRREDPQALAAAMLDFIREPSRITAMGERSRELATRKFDVHAVNRLLLVNMGLA